MILCAQSMISLASGARGGRLGSLLAAFQVLADTGQRARHRQDAQAYAVLGRSQPPSLVEARVAAEGGQGHAERALRQFEKSAHCALHKAAQRSPSALAWIGEHRPPEASRLSRLASLLLSYIPAVCDFVAPRHPGASTTIFDRLSHSRALSSVSVVF